MLQSHSHPLPASWLEDCMYSVKHWAKHNRYEYRFIDDELFGYIPKILLEKTQNQLVIASDLARLRALQHFLQHGYQTVIWCDADVLIFAPHRFNLLQENFAVGREVWIQQDHQLKLTAHIKVHNAFMMFRQGNTFLDFYADTAEHLLKLNKGTMPPQFIGPKLLTAIHNIVQCPVMETAGMLSPLVIKDMARQQGAALNLFQRRSPQPIAAANLCNSLFQSGQISKVEIERCITKLIDNRLNQLI